MMGLTDTHCHIHAATEDRGDFTAKKWQEANETDPDMLIKSAGSAGVDRLICVGTDLADSTDAANFVQNRDNCYASIGVHPHEAKDFLTSHKDLKEFERLIRTARKIVAIGEVGLDYYYQHSPRKEQITLLEMFLQLAKNRDLPVIFHIRDAYDDFWPILANFEGLRGVLHSYTDVANLAKALERGLYIGLNGIMTFTREKNQQEMARKVPLNRLLVETDAPYLAPKPYRGKVCKPEYVKATAEFLCGLRNENFEEFAVQTSKNANELFELS